jgi:hypothetical protein
VLDLCPTLVRERKLRKRLAIDESLAGEYCHLLTVTTVSVSVSYLVLLYAELLSQLLLQTGRVESGQ